MGWVTSLRLPPVGSTANGTPPASGDRMVFGAQPAAVYRTSAGLGRPECPHVTRVDHRAGQVQRPGRPEFGKQDFVHATGSPSALADKSSTSSSRTATASSSATCQLPEA
jgi:hypothetical protein